MHAKIGNPGNAVAMARFRKVLVDINAEMINQHWALDVVVAQFRIGDATLSVFSDDNLVDVDGPDELIQRIITGLGETACNQILRG